MKKLLAVAVMAVTLCLAGMVISGEAQAQRFVDNGDGTVTDAVTGLMWTKDANPFGRLNWHDAMSRSSSFSISGIGGWRLPSRDELVTLSHAIRGGHPYNGVQWGFYWSDTRIVTHDGYAWFVFMGDGIVADDVKTNLHYVWPVRAGQ